MATTGATMSESTRDSAEFTLPWPPSVNSAYRSPLINGEPRTMLSRRGRAYKKLAAASLALQSVPRFGAARVAVEIEVFPPDRRRRDLGNLDKLLLDALQPTVIDDDAQVDYLVFDRRRTATVPGGRVNVVVTVLPDYTSAEAETARCDESTPAGAGA